MEWPKYFYCTKLFRISHFTFKVVPIFLKTQRQFKKSIENGKNWLSLTSFSRIHSSKHELRISDYTPTTNFFHPSFVKWKIWSRNVTHRYVRYVIKAKGNIGEFWVRSHSKSRIPKMENIRMIESRLLAEIFFRRPPKIRNSSTS